jgi:hypothetical protein
MSKSNPWPPQAKLTVAGLVIVLFAVAGIAGANGRASDASSRATTTSTAPQLTVMAVGGSTVSTSSAPSTTRPVTTTTRPTSKPRTAPPKPKPTPPKSKPPAPSSPAPGAAAALAALPTGYLDTSHPYKRTLDFGAAWTDNNNDPGGHNGCDTRDDILHRDLTGIVTRPGTNDCVVVAGQLADRYTGTTILFMKLHATAIQIDHVVPLHDAWELGAYAWSQSERVDYANDPVVLLAVSGPENESKGDKLADAWRPPNAAEWCDYAIRTIGIHAKYRLPVTTTERQALQEMLARC